MTQLGRRHFLIGAAAARNSRYVRAEVRRLQPTLTTPDTMVALTNPIFLGRLAKH